MDLSAKRISKSMWCLLGIILFIILFSLISPYLAPDDPYLTHSDNILAAPDMNHLFGTDNHGRDVLSRVMVGSRSSIFAAFAIIACGRDFGKFCGSYGRLFRREGGCLSYAGDRYISRISRYPSGNCRSGHFRRQSFECHVRPRADGVDAICPAGTEFDYCY